PPSGSTASVLESGGARHSAPWAHGSLRIVSLPSKRSLEGAMVPLTRLGRRELALSHSGRSISLLSLDQPDEERIDAQPRSDSLAVHLSIIRWSRPRAILSVDLSSAAVFTSNASAYYSMAWSPGDAHVALHARRAVGEQQQRKVFIVSSRLGLVLSGTPLSWSVSSLEW